MKSVVFCLLVCIGYFQAQIISHVVQVLVESEPTSSEAPVESLRDTNWFDTCRAGDSKTNSSEEEMLTLNTIETALANYNKDYPCYCGSRWQQKYKELHENILNGKRPKALLVLIPNISGLADRIVGCITTFMVAYLTDRAFQIGQRSILHPLDHIFTSPMINWTRAADPDWLLAPLLPQNTERNYNETILKSKEYYAVNTIDDQNTLRQLIDQDLHVMMGSDARMTLMIINRGRTIPMFGNPFHSEKLQQTGLDQYNTFGCLLRYLFQPKPSIFLHIPQLFMQMTNPDSQILKIAIQIRTGDRFLIFSPDDHDINIVDFQAYFHCADQIEKRVMSEAGSPYKSVVWYLVTDSVPLRQAAIKTFGSKVITANNAVVEHSSKEACRKAGISDCTVSNVGFETAAAEWWLLMYARYFVISEYSGYGRTGAAASLHADSTYTVRYNERASSSIVCDAASFTTLQSFANDWSGI